MMEEKGNGESDSSSGMSVECDLLVPETWLSSDKSPASVECSELLVEQLDRKEDGNLSNDRAILSCDGDLQCGSPECPDTYIAFCSIKAGDVNDINDSVADMQIEENCDDSSIKPTSCQVDHVCHLEDEISCGSVCRLCKDLSVRNHAASVVDEILQLAAKHVLKMKFRNRNAGLEAENIDCQKSNLETSDLKEVTNNTAQINSKWGKAVVQYVGPFDIGNSLLRQSSSMGHSLSKSVPNLSLSDELIVGTENSEFQSYIDTISGHYISPMCKQSSLFGCDSIPKSKESVSGIVSLRECDKKIHAQNLLDEQDCDRVSKVECSKNCSEETKNDKEDSVALSKYLKNSISEFDALRIGVISEEENCGDGSLFNSNKKVVEKLKSGEHLDALKLDAGSGALVAAVQVLPEESVPSEGCTFTTEESNQEINDLSDQNLMLPSDKSTSDNSELMLELNAEAKDLKDCLVSSEHVSTLLDTQEQCGLNELNEIIEDINSKDVDVYESLSSVCSPKDGIVDTSICLQESHREERNVESDVTPPDSYHDNVSDGAELFATKPELLGNVKDESLSDCLENSETESPISQTLAQPSSNVFEEKCGNCNTSADTCDMVSPAYDAGDHCAPSVENKKLTLRKVGALGDVPPPVLTPEKDGDSKLLSSEQDIHLGTQIENNALHDVPAPSLNDKDSDDSKLASSQQEVKTLDHLAIKKNQYPALPSKSSQPHEVYPAILEEEYEGASTEESELSYTTSDAEGDLRLSKSSHDGINPISYMPLVEDDLKSRSTLSLISELDESCKETNFIEDQVEDDSSALLNTEDVINKQDRTENVSETSSSELTQRVRGQRIRHDQDDHNQEMVEEDSPRAKYSEKISEIKRVLKSSSSVERLRELRKLARSEGGLVVDELRREAWPLLLGIDSAAAESPLPPVDASELRSHPEYNQVVLDVNRSLRRFPSKLSLEERLILQEQLTEIILRVLIKRRELSYYQGYHDVAVTTLLVAGKDAAFHILEGISVAHLSDCMRPSMDRTVYLLNYIYPLLQRISPHLSERLDRLEVGTIFCLPWFLTWYGYSLNRHEDVVRVFDYFVASPPLAPLYLAAVVVARRSAEVLTADCDYATVHSLLSRIPESLPLEEMLSEATDLYRDYPPSVIENEVRERYERLRKAQEEEEEQRRRVRQMRMVRRRHSMPVIPRQFPGWFSIKLIIAPVMLGMITWHLRNEMFRYF